MPRLPSSSNTTPMPPPGLGLPSQHHTNKNKKQRKKHRSTNHNNRHLGSDPNPSPDLQLHLEGLGGFSNGPHPERKTDSSGIDQIQHASKEVDQEVVGRWGEEGLEIRVIHPQKLSFSLALKECQTRRFRSDGLPSPVGQWKQRRRLPVSLDLNGQMSDTSVSSSRSFVMGGGSKENSVMPVHGRTGVFPSPGTPNYRHGGAANGYQKGWSSERVPLPSNVSRRFGSSTALLPLGNAKGIPSKWEDAEKWICSPVSVDGAGASQAVLPPHHRRPKSKSGPLGNPAGVGPCYSLASPSLPCFDGGRMRNLAANSPLMGGVLVADGGCYGGSSGNSEIREGNSIFIGGGRKSYSAQSEHSMMRSASVHGWSDLLLESSSSWHSSQDEKFDSQKGDTTIDSYAIPRKDLATQMSPGSSTHSSTKERQQLTSPSHSSLPIVELQSHSSKLEVRDVQVDDRVTVTRWSKKHVARGLDKKLANITLWKNEAVESPTEAWKIIETAKCMSKSKREEAKIAAWENLQKAKAEAAIRNLEMKLEKKRSSSMDKILSKLRSAQRRAQDMRKTVTSDQTPELATPTKKTLIFRRTGHVNTLSGCFTCHAF